MPPEHIPVPERACHWRGSVWLCSTVISGSTAATVSLLLTQRRLARQVE
ncbi:hypothetical protein ACLBOM_22650 [Escherichia coli]